MPKLVIIVGILFGYNLHIILGCEVLAKIKSETKKPFIFELSMTDVFKEQVEFSEPGQKEILIKASECAAKRWKLLTVTKDESGTLTAVDEAYTKLDGIGEMTIHIGDELQPRLQQRLGIVCSEATLNLCI
ncbi:hypothetical protein GPALN_010901 [Globodera pallida]|uniref:Uncharacterized protein n=1 Tax=Globodera pallida TaxID=36090 RepID=A0A183BKG1_GLOPA|nr:hypothetical protein GPALN_010901 [Globodera pallida]